MIWQIDVVLAVAVVSIISGVTSVYNAYIIRKERKNAPDNKRWEEFEEWRKSVDKKLDNDSRRFKDFERMVGTLDKFQRVSLKVSKGILQLSATEKSENHAEEVKLLEREIDSFLIEKEL